MPSISSLVAIPAATLPLSLQVWELVLLLWPTEPTAPTGRTFLEVLFLAQP